MGCLRMGFRPGDLRARGSGSFGTVWGDCGDGRGIWSLSQICAVVSYRVVFNSGAGLQVWRGICWGLGRVVVVSRLRSWSRR